MSALNSNNTQAFEGSVKVREQKSNLRLTRRLGIEVS